MNEKQKLDRDLEEVFHMNAKMKDIESKIQVNANFHNKLSKKSKLKISQINNKK